MGFTKSLSVTTFSFESFAFRYSEVPLVLVICSLNWSISFFEHRNTGYDPPHYLGNPEVPLVTDVSVILVVEMIGFDGLVLGEGGV